MPLVSMSIIPDFSDGSVYSFSDDGSFLLRVSVTPEKYIEKLIDNDGIICMADFRSVITKATPENPDFTVIGEITSGSVEEGYLTASFALAEDEMKKMLESDYVVSFSIEDADVVHGASTSYVPMNNPRRDKGGDVDDEDVIIINGHNAVKLAGCYWATENVGECSGLLWNCPLINNDWGCCFYSEKYAKNAARIWGSENGHKWALPNNEQWQALMDDCYWEWTDSYDNPDSPDNKRSGYIVYEAKSEEDKGRHEKGTDNTYSPSIDRHIFILATGLSSLDDSQAHDQGTDGGYWSASSNTDFRFSNGWMILHYGGTNGAPDNAFAVRLASN